MHANIKKGELLESNTGKIAYVKEVLEDKLKVLINGKKEIILNTDLSNWSYINPIKDDRIVSDTTFALRFKHFLERIPQEFILSHPMLYEEYDYMLHVAKRLLKYQIQTVTDEYEIKYLKMNDQM